ncbi:MAG: hypothetical protein KatS3mg057_1530 [Herpetosiphonaceae bacterium]|nr:MAG: hypothetical protein KatS3mg057_1530 [Herpetosiphonaceae bacterium]
MIQIDGVDYLTVDEACRMLGVKPATIYAYVSRGVLKSYKQRVGRMRLYRRDEIEALRRIEATERRSAALEENDRAEEGHMPEAEAWMGEL